MRFVLINQASSAPLTSQVTDAWLTDLAEASTIQLNRDLSPNWGGSYSVRAGTAAQVVPGEIVMAILDDLPNAPSAIAYHDVDGNAAPVAFLGLSTCHSLDDVSIAVTHELCETAGDAGCNIWVQSADTTMVARELCDAVEASSYAIGSIRVSDFLLPAFFVANARGPFSYTESVGGPMLVPGPFGTAHGGYQIIRTGATTETQVNGSVRAYRAEKLAHWSSRAARRR